MIWVNHQVVTFWVSDMQTPRAVLQGPMHRLKNPFNPAVPHRTLGNNLSALLDRRGRCALQSLFGTVLWPSGVAILLFAAMVCPLGGVRPFLYSCPEIPSIGVRHQNFPIFGLFLFECGSVWDGSVDTSLCSFHAAGRNTGAIFWPIVFTPPFSHRFESGVSTVAV